jgi:NAD(P)H-hydrate repair Nnr-like enzyme with NAD(P)H-hydrate dehydratase domain
MAKDAMQILTGHGNFNSYLHKIGKSPHHLCEECIDEDSIEHRLLHCVKFEVDRIVLGIKLDREPTMKDLVIHALEHDSKLLKRLVQ